MKKLVLIAVLALCLALTSAAHAEGASCCCCCRSAQEAASLPEEDAVSATPDEPDVQDDYTLEVVHEDYHVFLPSYFEPKNERNREFIVPGGSENLKINVIVDNPFFAYIPAGYVTDQQRDRILKRLAYREDYEPVQIGECLGALVYVDDPSRHEAQLYCTNRKNKLFIFITADSREEVESLVQGILEHIVAPEMPLEAGAF